MAQDESHGQDSTTQGVVKRCAKFLPYLPSTLLVIVALNQLFLAHTVNLSAWLGGGFGMFSTTDDGGNRHLHVLAVHPGIDKEVLIPRSLEDLERRTRALPSESQLRKLAGAIAGSYDDKEKSLSAIRVQVWRTEFDHESLRPQSRIMREFVFKVDGERYY